MRVLAFTKYDSRAASTRQRFLQFKPALAKVGIHLDYSPLLGNDHLQRLVEGRRASPPAVARSYVRRAGRLLTARSYDLLWVHCEFFPYLPGFVEALAAGTSGRPIVFDYDDAIFHMYDSAPNPLVRQLLKGKLEPLLRRATACVCGNEYLRDYAAQFCPNSIIVPTTVDTDVYVPATAADRAAVPVIGWIGSPSTWRYMRPLLPILSEMAAEGRVVVRIVGADFDARSDLFPGMELITWSESGEVAEVQKMDIGIMPLPDDKWERRKSGYKLIQYMACGLPVIASPVGVNRKIVTRDTGFLASNKQEWREALSRLIGDNELRSQLGRNGRKRVEAHYSLASQAPRLIDLLKSAAQKVEG